MNAIERQLPLLRDRARALSNTIPPPSIAEKEEAGMYLVAYREFWKRVGELSKEEATEELVGLLWKETFGSYRCHTLIGLLLQQGSLHLPTSHILLLQAYFVIFLSGVDEIIYDDELEEKMFASSIDDLM